jgi:hypothetical protein
MMQLVTANHIKDELKSLQKCEGIDLWITDDIRPSFIRSDGKPIRVDSSRVVWSRANFEPAMITRGFGVKWECEDRPCSSPYYTITLG